MRKLFGAVMISVSLALVIACGPPRAVEVRLTGAQFGTTGGNLFNCTTPDFPANTQSIDDGVIRCIPQRNGATLSTTPVIVNQRVGCGDGHGALVTVSCAGTGTADDVAVTVTLSLTASCSDEQAGSDPSQFVAEDIVAGDTQSSPPLQSCALFDNLCGSSNACAFNAFSATVSVTNMTE